MVGFVAERVHIWWINYFNDMRDSRIYSDDDIIQREFLKFCFMHILREELYRVAKLWNVKTFFQPRVSPGRPNIFFFMPETMGSHDYIIPVSLDDIELTEERYTIKAEENGCDEDFNELATLIMDNKQLEMPRNAEEATRLYLSLLDSVDNI